MPSTVIWSYDEVKAWDYEVWKGPPCSVDIIYFLLKHTKGYFNFKLHKVNIMCLASAVVVSWITQVCCLLLIFCSTAVKTRFILFQVFFRRVITGLWRLVWVVNEKFQGISIYRQDCEGVDRSRSMEIIHY